MTSDTTNVTKDVVFADPPGSDHWIEAPVPLGDLNADIMDVAFTKAVGCTQYPGGCDGMRKEHRFADTVPLGENWRHKYLIDLDGMGYSARLFSLLASESAVMKTTVYTEFFSGKQPVAGMQGCWLTANSRQTGSSHGSISSRFPSTTTKSTTSGPTFPALPSPCSKRPTSRATSLAGRRPHPTPRHSTATTS
jgi:hypothetical protein